MTASATPANANVMTATTAITNSATAKTTFLIQLLLKLNCFWLD